MRNDVNSDLVTLDDILLYLGEFGIYQKALFVMLMPFCFFLTFVYFTQIFLTLVPVEHWCTLPEGTGISIERLRDIAIPKADQVPFESGDVSYSRCWIYDVPIDQIVNASRSNKEWPIKKCHSWDYNFTRDMPYSTIATEQGWVCDQAYLVNLAQSIFFIGSICGGFLFGWLADKKGRIPVLVCTNVMGLIGGLATTFSTAFWQFSLCRFIVGFAYDNTFVIMYILVLEYIGPKCRTFVGNMSYGVFYTMGCMCLPWIAYYVANWKTLAVVTSVPMCFVILTPWIVPESVRWLISKGKIEKAVRIIRSIERINKTDVPQDIYEKFIDDCMDSPESSSEEDYNIFVLFKTPRLRTFTVLLIIGWSIIAMVYDCHIRCLENLGHDVFTSFTIGASTELPAEVLITITLDVCGRRWMLIGAIFLSGLACFCACVAPIGMYYATFAIIGRFFLNIASNIALQYASELLPTVVRAEGVAFIHNMGYAASMLSPFVAYTSKIQYNIPMMIMGSVCMVAGVLSIFLPETLKEHLPQTLLDGELFGINQKITDCPIKRKNFHTVLNRHYLHANRPVSRGDVLRSSMVSGYTGNETRLKARRQIISDIDTRESRTSSAETPEEYVSILRKRNEEMQSSQPEVANRRQKLERG
ncbi:organic cation transporter protein-like [Cephus cinctus]|uniref:Organic cation transporter protein-like n=1 Tax=Cephus cinctus TaxID=211228 RepID=A0AAJ7BXV7_CEPCN|nr:organic cation transporter protein-like [Cephus cinctus]